MQYETIARLPDRPNIKLIFKSEAGLGIKDIQFYMDELSSKGREASKAIIYCKCVSD